MNLRRAPLSQRGGAFYCLTLLLGILCIPLFLAIDGCGSGGTQPGQTLHLSDACSDNQFRPNYCGDLSAMYFWQRSSVTYRILDGTQQATAIDLTNIGSVTPSETQRGDIRGAFTKWQEETPGVEFLEVAATDTSARIDVVVQSAEQFAPVQSFFFEGFGDTRLYPPGGGPVLDRAVIRLRDLRGSNERTFRYFALHEVGHALGMIGHSRDVGDVMYERRTLILRAIELTERDRNTVRANYKRPQ
jgi:hypothetical protein